jgi:hypothetical protein
VETGNATMNAILLLSTMMMAIAIHLVDALNSQTVLPVSLIGKLRAVGADHLAA